MPCRRKNGGDTDIHIICLFICSFLFSFCNKPPSVLADFLVQQITQVSAFSMFHMKSMTSKKHNTICNTLSRIAPG